MSEKVSGRNGDIALFLYAGPFIVNFLYALYVWSGVGFSSTLPQLVYLEVAQSPYIFLVGFAAVLLAGVIDFNDEAPTARKGAVAGLSRRLQWVAVISLLLAFVSALYSAGGDPGTAISNMFVGRYPLIFPALLVVLSFLVLPGVRIQGANTRNLTAVLLLILSPAALYELGKRSVAAGLGVSLLFLLIAAYILVAAKKD